MTFPVHVSIVAKLELKSIMNTIACSFATVKILVRGVMMYILSAIVAVWLLPGGIFGKNWLEMTGGVGVPSAVVVPGDTTVVVVVDDGK